MSEYVVELKHITKRFPGIIANDDVTIQIKAGEIFALLGENGAGKSTLMNILFGLYEQDEGEIYINGDLVNIKSPIEASKLGIGMVHQHFKLIDNYTVTENIILGVEPSGNKFGFLPYLKKKEADEKIKELSKKYGLEVDPKKKISELPVSTQQRVEILKMLYRDAEILIFDEPTAVLTPQEIDYLLQIISDLRDKGKTIILITHKLEEIKKVADRCAILRKGKLIDVHDVKSTSTKVMANLMVGRDLGEGIEKSEHSFGEVVLDVKDLCVANENKFETVKDVSFSIRKGEIFSIAGVSGNGQTDIADAITGIKKIKSGNVYLKNEDITNLSVKERILKEISYIPEDRQNDGLILDFNLKDNLSLKRYFDNPFSDGGLLNETYKKKYSDKLIDEYDIRSAEGSETIVRSMSGGNQQKAIIAREIDLDSELIIFVQPTRGLDVGAIDNIHKQIIDVRDQGKAILLISLELDEVMKLSDTIAVIYNGELLKIDSAKNLTKSEVGNYMMGVRDEYEKGK